MTEPSFLSYKQEVFIHCLTIIHYRW